MFVALFLLALAIVSPAMAKDVPDWITQRLDQAYTPISEETDAVLLYSETIIGYRKGAITSREKRLYRLIRLEGLGYGQLSLNVVKGTKISDVEGFRFNGSGEFLEKLRRENIHRTAFSKYVHDDYEQFWATFQGLETGDFVAFEYELTEKPFFKTRLLSLGRSIEVAHMRVEIPPEATGIILNDPGNTVQSSGKTYTIQGQPAFKSEENSPSFRERIPSVGIVFDSEGDRSWDAFGREYWDATEGISVLSEQSREDLRDLLAISDRQKFIETTLRHVSQTVRYVAIEVGDGGIIPSPADHVHTKKYGDCKDMAFYARAILEAGGVTSYPVLALPQDYGTVFEEFPADQFNHAILAVELDQESLALKNIELDGKPYLIADLTDKFTEYPMIGYGLENTHILIVKKNGSKLATLPRSTPDDNSKVYDVHIALNADRTADYTLTETCSGHFAALEKSRRETFEKQKEKEIYEKWVQRLVPGSEMNHFAIEEIGDKVVTRVQFSARNVGTSLEDQLYIIPNIVEATVKGYRRRTRESDMVISYKYARRVNVTVDIDKAFSIIDIPTEVQMDNDNFSSLVKASKTAQNVNVQIEFAWKTNRIDPDQYPDFRKSYQDYLKSAKSQIALKPA